MHYIAAKIHAELAYAFEIGASRPAENQARQHGSDSRSKPPERFAP
jgi:hypothetical protein